MNTPMKFGGFVVGLALVFGAAAAVGSAVGPLQAASAENPAGHSEMNPEQMTAAGGTAAADIPGGLMVSQNGYTLALRPDALPAGASTRLVFRVLGPDGRPVTSYDRTHDKELHLIAVRRDMTGFQHVHPELAADGTWSAPLALTSGEWRVFADFAPAGSNGAAITLGADLSVAGDYAPRPLPQPSRTAQVDGYTVTLSGALVPGKGSPVTLTVSKGGVPVTDLQPYLAAYGHLVALRNGDLAYLHVHPAGAPGDGRTPAGPQIQFVAEVPSAGNYRLFLDFRHGDVVHTAEFTAAAAGADAPGEPAGGHGPDAGTDGHGG